MRKVSVFMITYNHEKYIGEAIESIMGQKTNFDFELVIGEDCGKDQTRSICSMYAEKYPGKINLLAAERNLGVMGNTLKTLEACTGTYIAFCEGDDYWLDANKLQKQVDFLDAHPDYSICFGNVSVVDEMGWNLEDTYYFPVHAKETYTIDDIILSEMNLIPTPTMVVRNVLPKPFPDFAKRALAGDLVIQLWAADKGKAKYIDEKMAIYRNHHGGITKNADQIERADKVLMEMFQEFNEYTGFRYDAIFHQRFLNNARMHLIYGARDKKGLQRVRHYFKRMPAYLKYSKGMNLKELLYYHYVLLFPGLVKRRLQKSAEEVRS